MDFVRHPNEAPPPPFILHFTCCDLPVRGLANGTVTPTLTSSFKYIPVK